MTAPAERAINVPLLRKTLEHIEAHPREWNQKTWRCETGFCFAGWAVELTGGRWVTYGNGLYPYVLAEDDDPPEHVDYDGEVECAYRAERILGLTGQEAQYLFHSENTLDDLRRIVADLCGGEL